MNNQEPFQNVFHDKVPVLAVDLPEVNKQEPFQARPSMPACQTKESTVGFASRDEADVIKLVRQKDAKSTKDSTKTAVKTFKEFLAQQNMDTNIETVSQECLNNGLRLFYVNARKKDGDMYKKSGLSCLRFGIARYLNQERGIDIVNNANFAGANQVFIAAIADLKQMGKGAIQHYPEISLTDLQKFYASFNVEFPAGLQDKVMFDIYKL